jgi:hypothetical protein
MTDSIEVRELNEEEYKVFLPRVNQFQTRFTFPLGDKHYYFDNGDDYFAWFRNMGNLHYFVALDGDEVVAVAAQIIRQLVSSTGEKTDPFWFLCDLKVHPDYRGLGVPEKIFTNRFPHHYFRCPRGYAVTIDPMDQGENAIVRMLQNFPLIPFSVATKLGVVMLDTELMEEVDPILRRHRGPVSYSSAAGIRDIVPENGGEPLQLLHAQFGPCAQPGYKNPVDDHYHMFCAPLGDSLLKDLEIRGIRPATTITVVHHRLDTWKWQFILTNEV